MTWQSIVEDWPKESREAAQLVVDTYGEPHETTPSLLLWYGVGPWKRMIASRTFYPHDFPVPHIDSVESVIEYRVPPSKATPVAEFDGSVVIERTAGEVSARCHDEQANLLALNLMHDIVCGEKDPEQARQYYAREFLDVRRRRPTPYLQRLSFQPGGHTADRDRQVLSDQDLEQAAEEGKQTERA